MINLISNAIKYTQKGYVKVTAKLWPQDNIRFIVEDSGVGIDEKNLKDLFSYFTKIKENRYMNPHGCGLGLTVSKALAKALGGDLSVESTKGKGSIFTLNIQDHKEDMASSHKNHESLFSRSNSALMVHHQMN